MGSIRSDKSCDDDVAYDDDFIALANKIAARALSGETFRGILTDAQAPPGSPLSSRRPSSDSQVAAVINFLARVYASAGTKEKDVTRAKVLVQYIMPRQKGMHSHFPNTKTINATLEAVLRLYQGTATNDVTHPLDETADLIFADTVLNFTTSRRTTAPTPDDERTFDLLMNLYTVLRPSDVGQRMEEVASQFETLIYSSPRPGASPSLDLYKRVFWGLWVEAQSIEARRCSKRALLLLDKLEMLSTPFVLSRKQVAAIGGMNLYEFNLAPTSKIYDLVLNVCVDTAAPGEYEMAAQVACEVGRRLLQRKAFRQTAAEKVQKCVDRLPSESVSIFAMKDIVLQLEGKV